MRTLQTKQKPLWKRAAWTTLQLNLNLFDRGSTLWVPDLPLDTKVLYGSLSHLYKNGLVILSKMDRFYKNLNSLFGKESCERFFGNHLFAKLGADEFK